MEIGINFFQCINYAASVPNLIMLMKIINLRLLSWLKSASVEPSYFFSILATALMGFGNTNLLLQKACRNDTSIEPDLSTACDDVEKGVICVTRINTYVAPVSSILVVISVILYSSCSDIVQTKLKFILMLTMFGHLLESILMCLHSYWWSLSPMSAAISNSVLHIICGNRITLATFASLYLTNQVDERSRTTRFIILSAITTFGSLVADTFSGHLLHAAGFLRYYMVCFFFAAVALICGHFFIESQSKQTSPSTSTVISFRPILTSLRVTLGKGSSRQRTIITLSLAVHTILIFIHQGKINVF